MDPSLGGQSEPIKHWGLWNHLRGQGPPGIVCMRWPLPSHLALSPHIPTKVTSRCLRSRQEPDTCLSRRQTPPATTWVSVGAQRVQWICSLTLPGIRGPAERHGCSPISPVPGLAHLVDVSWSHSPMERPGVGIRGLPWQQLWRDMCLRHVTPPHPNSISRPRGKPPVHWKAGKVLKQRLLRPAGRWAAMIYLHFFI